MNPTNLIQSKPVLTNAEVEAYLAMQETRKNLKSRLELIENSADRAEAEILAKIEFGADLSACGFAISVSQSERRFPKWKEEFISRCGKAEADLVLEVTSPIVYRRLVIS